MLWQKLTQRDSSMDHTLSVRELHDCLEMLNTRPEEVFSELWSMLNVLDAVNQVWDWFAVVYVVPPSGSCFTVGHANWLQGVGQVLSISTMEQANTFRLNSSRESSHRTPTKLLVCHDTTQFLLI